MANKIGPTFNAELAAAGGLNLLPFSWNEEDGTLTMTSPDLTDEQKAAIKAVYAAHDPTKQGPRTVQGAVLVHALDKATKVTARDLAYVAGLVSAREDMASLVRISAVDGLTPKAWFDLALGVAK